MVGRKFHSFWNENRRGKNASFCIDFEKFVKFDLNVAYKQLWLLEKDPSMWERERALLVEGESVYRFVKDYSAGHIHMDGTQPWIVDILMNKTTYKIYQRHTTTQCFSVLPLSEEDMFCALEVPGGSI